MHVKKFAFNPFQENTYILYDETKECLIIDPGCYYKTEEQELLKFINDNSLRLVRLLNTHCHLDHIFGNYFVHKTFGLLPELHELELSYLNNLLKIADMYSIPHVNPSPEPTSFLKETDKITFGNSELRILFVPGHSTGHLAFVSDKDKFAISGDVLFYESIGRTDLPGGNFETLASSIKEKMYTLPDDFTIYSGHGPETSIGHEKLNNPFVKA